MTLASARVRIGRIRLKSGGADLRVLHRPVSDTDCRERVRSWASSVLSNPAPPQAFVAIAFRHDPGQPGGMDNMSAWWSDHAAFPLELLPALAVSTLRRHQIEDCAERHIMRALGYELDEPDGAA